MGALKGIISPTALDKANVYALNCCEKSRKMNKDFWEATYEAEVRRWLFQCLRPGWGNMVGLWIGKEKQTQRKGGRGI